MSWGSTLSVQIINELGTPIEFGLNTCTSVSVLDNEVQLGSRLNLYTMLLTIYADKRIHIAC